MTGITVNTIGEHKIIVAVIFIAVVGSAVFFALNDSSPNRITGHVTTTSVTIVGFVPFNCSFSLSSGMNMVSFPCIPLYENVSTVLAPINDSVYAIFYYDPLDSADPWKSYNPALPSWATQQLTELSRASGYIIIMNQSAAYFLAGSRKYTTIQTVPGWNMIAYPGLSSSAVNSTFGSLSFTILRTYDPSTGQWLTYIPGSSGNTLTILEPYTGYWMQTNISQSLNIAP